MSKNHDDHALGALKRAAQKVSPDFSESLLEDLYLIQKEHQFDEDRAAVVDKISNRILQEIGSGDTQSSEN